MGPKPCYSSVADRRWQIQPHQQGLALQRHHHDHQETKPRRFQRLSRVCTEMVTLGMLHHPNIIKILGYCMTGFDRLRIYKFIQNGCLDQWLQQEQNVATPTLSWRTRIQIVRGASQLWLKIFQLLNRISIWIYTVFYECYNVIKIDIRNKMEEEYFYDCYGVIY